MCDFQPIGEISVEDKNTYSNFIKLAKLQCAIAIDGRPDVFTVLTVFNQLQLSDATNISKPRLDLGHIKDLEEGVRRLVNIIVCSIREYRAVVLKWGYAYKKAPQGIF